MSGAGAFPFDPARIAALGRLADEINGQHAPPPIAAPVLLDSHGRVLLPVPALDDRFHWATVDAGLTLQWAPCPEQDGMLIVLWGGEPGRPPVVDPIAAFLTAKGLRALITDLQAIDAALGAQSP